MGSPATIAQIQSGAAYIMRRGTTTWVAAHDGDQINPGDSFLTDQNTVVDLNTSDQGPVTIHGCVQTHWSDDGSHQSTQVDPNLFNWNEIRNDASTNDVSNDPGSDTGNNDDDNNDDDNSDDDNSDPARAERMLSELPD